MFFGFQGGSNSTVLISILVYRLKLLKESGLVSTLTSWEMFNIMSPDYILPLLNISTIGKSKQVLDILTKLNIAVYGYSLNIKMTGGSFDSLKHNAVVANLKIQTSFCIGKCLVSNKEKGNIYNLQNCQTLMPSDISDTKGLFTKIYDNHCRDQSSLDWSMDLFTINFLHLRSLKVQLPGIYEKAEVYIYYHNYSTDSKEDQLMIRLQDERIPKIVDTSFIYSFI